MSDNSDNGPRVADEPMDYSARLVIAIRAQGNAVLRLLDTLNPPVRVRKVWRGRVFVYTLGTRP